MEEGVEGGREGGGMEGWMEGWRGEGRKGGRKGTREGTREGGRTGDGRKKNVCGLSGKGGGRGTGDAVRRVCGESSGRIRLPPGASRAFDPSPPHTMFGVPISLIFPQYPVSYCACCPRCFPPLVPVSARASPCSCVRVLIPSAVPHYHRMQNLAALLNSRP